MTVSYRLKAALVAYLDTIKPSSSISVVDATQREEIALPTLAVEVISAEAHSRALSHVQRCAVEFRLRTHAGDEDDASIASWIDQIESSLNDPAEVKILVNEQIEIDYWIFSGTNQEWDESTLETIFSAECLCRRI